MNLPHYSALIIENSLEVEHVQMMEQLADTALQVQDGALLAGPFPSFDGL